MCLIKLHNSCTVQQCCSESKHSTLITQIVVCTDGRRLPCEMEVELT
uniref:Uncharacterized protein n=1 Tax=Anguilla anguilla TaxID=7936 RepID=A0A0E9RFD1_ANGAN